MTLNILTKKCNLALLYNILFVKMPTNLKLNLDLNYIGAKSFTSQTSKYTIKWILVFLIFQNIIVIDVMWNFSILQLKIL